MTLGCASEDLRNGESDSIKEGSTRNAQGGEFKNFEELVWKLLAVPKEELDKQRAAYQENKDRNPKPDG